MRILNLRIRGMSLFPGRFPPPGRKSQCGKWLSSRFHGLILHVLSTRMLTRQQLPVAGVWGKKAGSGSD